MKWRKPVATALIVCSMALTGPYILPVGASTPVKVVNKEEEWIRLLRSIFRFDEIFVLLYNLTAFDISSVGNLDLNNLLPFMNKISGLKYVEEIEKFMKDASKKIRKVPKINVPGMSVHEELEKISDSASAIKPAVMPFDLPSFSDASFEALVSNAANVTSRIKKGSVVSANTILETMSLESAWGRKNSELSALAETAASSMLPEDYAEELKKMSLSSASNIKDGEFTGPNEAVFKIIHLLVQRTDLWTETYVNWLRIIDLQARKNLLLTRVGAMEAEKFTRSMRETTAEKALRFDMTIHESRHNK